MDAFIRTVQPVSTDAGRLFVTIKWDGKALSMTGVEGPLASGNCKGSCGQVIMSFKDYDARGHMLLADAKVADGWSAEDVRRLFDAWDRWHNNDVRAGCEHQRAEKWSERPIDPS